MQMNEKCWLALLVLNSNITVCKQMGSCSFKNNVNGKLFTYKLYMYKQDLALNNPQGLICYKTQAKHKLPIWIRVDLGVMATKEYSMFFKTPDKV